MAGCRMLNISCSAPRFVSASLGTKTSEEAAPVGTVSNNYDGVASSVAPGRGVSCNAQNFA